MARARRSGSRGEGEGFRRPAARAQPGRLEQVPRQGQREDGHRFLERAWASGPDAFCCALSETSDFARSRPGRPELFTPMVVLELLKDAPLAFELKADILALLADKRTPEGLHHFFVEEALLPADADCTAIANGLLLEFGLLPEAAASRTADRIEANRNADGLLCVYFTDDPGRRHVVDPVVCANALSFLTRLGRQRQARETIRFLVHLVDSRGYEEGTRYYPSADAFLFFAARLVHTAPAGYRRLGAALKRRIEERWDADGTPLDLAFRAIAADFVGARPRLGDLRGRLVSARRAGGVWGACPFFRYGRSAVYFGSEIVTTAFALRALASLPRATGDLVPTADLRPASALGWR